MYIHISLWALVQSALGLSIAGHIESFDEIKHSPHVIYFINEFNNHRLKQAIFSVFPSYLLYLL